MSRARRIVRVAGRSAALVFTAFWLIATSGPASTLAPACFTDMGASPSLQVLVGENQGTVCTQTDGIAPGATLVFDLARVSSGSDCIGYQTSAIHGLTNVTAQPAAHAPESFIEAAGTFTLPKDPSCQAIWSLDLAPGAPVQEGQKVSPLDASSSNPWVLQRTIIFAGAACRAALGATPTCLDRFAVDAITEQPAP
jgi:hypothetical protein